MKKILVILSAIVVLVIAPVSIAGEAAKKSCGSTMWQACCEPIPVLSCLK